MKAQRAITAEKHGLAVVLAEQLKVDDFSIEVAFKFQGKLADLVDLDLLICVREAACQGADHEHTCGGWMPLAKR